MTLTLRYLLDTDMCIYLLNGDEHVKSKIAQVGIETISKGSQASRSKIG